MSQGCPVSGYLIAQIHYFDQFFEQLNNPINKFQRDLMFGVMVPLVGGGWSKNNCMLGTYIGMCRRKVGIG